MRPINKNSTLFWPVYGLVPLLVLLAAIALSCIAAYFIVQGFGEFAPFRKIISKSTQLFLVLSIFPAMALLKINKAELGFASRGVFFKQLLLGLGLGLLTLLPIFILQYVLKINVIDDSRVWTVGVIAKNMAITLGVALLISLIEEPLFRGILLVGLRKKLPLAAAILLSATYYAALHFLSAKTTIPSQDIQLYTGFILLQEALGNLFNPAIWSAFCALLMVGIFLGVLRTQVPSSLGLCIGCHTGWVWQIKMSKQVFNTDYGSEYLYLVSSYDGVIGPLVTAWLLLAVVGYLAYRWFKTGDYSASDTQPRTSLLFNGLSAVLAFLLWGAWAYYVNANTDANQGLSSGLSQGTASFAITLLMVHLVSWFFKRLPDSFLKLPLAALCTVAITGSCLVAIHKLVGTPNIIATITPALTVAFIFSWYTAYQLQKIKSTR